MPRKIKYIQFALAAVVLAACQAKSEHYGKGPLELSNRAQAAFEDYKAAGIAAGAFAISEDGGRSSIAYTYCEESECDGNALVQAIELCQRRLRGMKCRIYAEGRHVVWQFGQPKTGTAKQ